MYSVHRGGEGDVDKRMKSISIQDYSSYIFFSLHLLTISVTVYNMFVATYFHISKANEYTPKTNHL